MSNVVRLKRIVLPAVSPITKEEKLISDTVAEELGYMVLKNWETQHSNLAKLLAALKMGLAAQKVLPWGELRVEFISSEMPDPFLVMEAHGADYYIAVWNEHSFSEKLLEV